MGNRTGKTINGTPAFRYVNDLSGDLSRVLVSKNLANSTQTYYVYGGSLISQGAAAANSRQYYLSDGLGNVRYVVDSAGISLQAYQYDPYGNPITGSNLTNFTFQEQQTDYETNLTYLRARYYDPTTGRFISKDPVAGTFANPQTQNGYSYANNDPVNLSDPSGKIPVLVVLAIAWAAAETGYSAWSMYDNVENCEYGWAAVDGASLLLPGIPGGVGRLDDGLRFLNKGDNIPGNPFRGANAPEQAFKQLKDNHGLDPHIASNRLHKIKQSGGVGAADNVVIGRTGDVYNEKTGEYLGSLTDSRWGK